MDTSTLFKSFVVAAGGFVGYFIGGWDVLFAVLLSLICIDYASGVIAAYISAELKSKVGFRGIAKKVMILLLVAVAALVDLVIKENGLDLNDMVRNAVIIFYITNEILSILENAGKIGLPVPDALTNAITVLKGKGK